MNKLFTTLLLFLPTWNVQSQNIDYFHPYRATDLRLPSVPLLTNDPFFSIWSPFNKLTDGSTRHWTDAEKPLEGYLRVDGTVYQFMGPKEKNELNPIVPSARDKAWEGRYTRHMPGNGWMNNGFDDSNWQQGKGAFGTPGIDNTHTRWAEENSDIYVRRTFNMSATDLQKDLFFIYSHDDNTIFYINGKLAITTKANREEDMKLHLPNNIKALLHEGHNVIAAHAHNNSGNALVDFGLYNKISKGNNLLMVAQQKAVSVMATSTYYTFTCGPVELNVVFTAPMLIDDLDLISTPVNFISYQVRSIDSRPHDMKVMITASPLIAINRKSQPTISTIIDNNGTAYLKTGTIDQPILATKGDGVGIDWGHLYISSANGQVALNSYNTVSNTFTNSGRLPKTNQLMTCRSLQDMPSLAYCHDFGSTTNARNFMMIGYDEIEDIEYMYQRYKGYWARNGKTIFEAFSEFGNRYDELMTRSRQLDQRIYDDAMTAGDKQYAEILSGSYRHVMAAHKLFQDKDGNILFFSKENNSNGCVNTVDLTYPEAPLFLLYNPTLQKGMMTSIFNYTKSGRWTKPFAAHDLGTYPIADGQVYGGDMPLEEAGNMIILTTMLSILDGNTKYADAYWDILKEWTDYLSANGQDPANQLCTDDFAGHWAHNCNLSIKAIMGVAGYALMCRMKGFYEDASKYMECAKAMAATWEQKANEGDHYRLAFDRKDTWSQKYNMIWDTLWDTHIFSGKVNQKEIAYYLKHQNTYGLPLDIRKDYSKND